MGQGQLLRKTIGTLTKVFCSSGPNLVVLPWAGDELLHGQAQDGVYFDFEVKFDLEGQGQSPLKTIWILNKIFYTYGQHLEIPSLNGRRVIARTNLVTDGLTDGQMQATTIPGGQNWPQVKMILILLVVGIPSRYCVEVTALLFMAGLKSVSVTTLEPPRPCMIFTHTRCN